MQTYLLCALIFSCYAVKIVLSLVSASRSSLMSFFVTSNVRRLSCPGILMSFDSLNIMPYFATSKQFQILIVPLHRGSADSQVIYVGKRAMPLFFA